MVDDRMNQPQRKSILCPNCRRLISSDERHCPHCNMAAPGARWKNNPLTRGWGSGDHLIRMILFTNIGLYLFSLVISGKIGVSGFNPLSMLSPSTTALVHLGATGTMVIGKTGWWTLISANYLHGSALHIFFNMMAFNQIAILIARLFGPYRFFTIFTLGGVGGFLASYVAGVPLTVGASAALCGLIGAALYYGKSRGGTYGQAIYKQVGGWAVIIIVFGFIVPQVNNWAHIGGMAAGALTALLLGYQEKSRESLSHRTLAGACMVITLLVLIFAVFRSMILWLS
jgi:rhomboid protease GluP